MTRRIIAAVPHAADNDNKVTIDVLANLIPGQDRDRAAAWFQACAEILRDHAGRWRRRTTHAAAQAARRKKHQGLANHLARLIVGGVSEETALATVANDNDLDPDWLRQLLPPALKEARELQRLQRDRAIVDLAAAGYGNAEIGRRHGLHEKSVARILERERKLIKSLAPLAQTLKVAERHGRTMILIDKDKAPGEAFRGHLEAARRRDATY